MCLSSHGGRVSRNHNNGNPVKYNKETDRWEFLDGTDAWDNPRVCTKCLKPQTEEGHDACLGTLPNVKYACCGHGMSHGYIYFENGTIVRFNDGEVENDFT